MPSLCDDDRRFDTVALLRGEMFVFKKEYVWRLTEDFQVIPGYPIRFNEIFQDIPNNVRHIDAAYERRIDGAIILFHGITAKLLPFSNFKIAYSLLRKQAKSTGYTMATLQSKIVHVQLPTTVLLKALRKSMQQWYGVKMVARIYSVKLDSSVTMKTSVKWMQIIQ